VRLTRSLRITRRVALVATLLALPSAWIVDRALGVDVVPIAAHDAATITVNRALHSPGSDVAEIYGTPLGGPIRVVAPDRGALIVPWEDPGVRLLAIDKAAGENPLQTATLWYFARVLAALSIGAVIALSFTVRRSGRQRLAAKPAGQTA
jgi:hypothetical protein